MNDKFKLIVSTTAIISIIALAFIGILSTWDVLRSDIAEKTIVTGLIIAFSSIVVLIVIKIVESKDGKI